MDISRNIETLCVQGGYTPKSGEPRVAPLYQSTTYYYETPEEMAHLFDSPKEGHLYSRISNPTVSFAEQKISLLEGGVAAMGCSSGMAAELLAIMTVAQAGDNIIACSKIYGGTYNLFNTTLPKYGIEVRMFDPSSTSDYIESLIDDHTRCLFGETIANPAMVIFDFDKLSSICKKYSLLMIIDNSLATPCFVKPFELGADVITHSSSKYLDGHAATIGGFVVDSGKFVFKNNPRYADFNTPDPSYHGMIYADEGAIAYILKARMQYMRDIGAIMSPFNAYIINLGMETLHLRMERHSSNAFALAEALSNHPLVEMVKYPALHSDCENAKFSKYFNGGCTGMLPFIIKDGKENALKFMKNLKLFKQVTHIADVRSCFLHPASTTHRQLSDEDLITCGVPAGLIRLSVGIESIKDIIADVLGALDLVK